MILIDLNGCNFCHAFIHFSGILAQEAYNGRTPLGKAYIAASYVKYVEGAGAQVVPIM